METMLTEKPACPLSDPFAIEVRDDGLISDSLSRPSTPAPRPPFPPKLEAWREISASAPRVCRYRPDGFPAERRHQGPGFRRRNYSLANSFMSRHRSQTEAREAGRGTGSWVDGMTELKDDDARKFDDKLRKLIKRAKKQRGMLWPSVLSKLELARADIKAMIKVYESGPK